MNEETRKLFSDLGSKNVRDLAFRDSWVFVGAKGVQNKSPFEQVWVESLAPPLPSSGQLAWPFCLLPVRSPSVRAACFPEFCPSIRTRGSLSPLPVGPGRAATWTFPVLYGFHPKEALNGKAFTLARLTTKKLSSQISTSSRCLVLSHPILPKPKTSIHTACPSPSSPGCHLTSCSSGGHMCQALCEGLVSPRCHPHLWEAPSSVKAMLSPRPAPHSRTRTTGCFSGIWKVLASKIAA